MTDYVDIDEAFGTAPLSGPVVKPEKKKNPHHETFSRLAESFGARITSLTRTPEHNRKVGGKPNSQHLPNRDSAGDFVVPKEKRKAFMAAAIAEGYKPIDEGDHIHLQLGSAGAVTQKPQQDSYSSEFADLPYVEQFKAQQLQDTGKPFHIKDGKVVAGEPIDSNAYVDMDEAFGVAKPAAVPVKEELATRSVGENITDWVHGFMNKEVKHPVDAVIEPVAKILDRAYTKVSNRILSATGVIGPESPNYDPIPYGPFSGDKAAAADAAHNRSISQKKEDAPTERQFGELGNPVDLILNDSLPANQHKIMQNITEQDWQGILDARNTASQIKIVSNPDKFPLVAVQAAQKAIDERLAKSSQGAGEMWRELIKAFKDDPGSVAVEFANSLMADPELALAPVGLGMKIISAQKIAGMSTKAASLAGRANKIADAAITTGSLSGHVTLADQIANDRETNLSEVALSTGMGAGMGGVIGLFMKNGPRRARLKQKIEDGAESSELAKEFEAGLAEDLAKEDNLIEDLLSAPKENNPSAFDADGNLVKLKNSERKKIETLLGIDKLTPEQRKEFFAKRTSFISKLSEPEKAAYFKAKAADRLNRARALSGDAADRAERDPAVAARQAKVASALEESPSAKVVRVNEELAAVEKAHAENPTEATAEALDSAIDEANTTEVVYAAAQGEAQLDAALQTAAARDAKRTVPRYQSGEIDPQLVARLGVGSLFAGTAYALNQDADTKAAGAFVAGLTALTLPGGGRIGRRLLQSGAVDAETGLIGAIVRGGEVIFPKLSPEDEAAYLAHQKTPKPRSPVTQEEIDLGLAPKTENQRSAARDLELVEKVKSGNMDAFNTIYKENATYLFHVARKNGLSAADAEEALQNTFMYLHEHISSYDPTKSAFRTWLHRIAESQANMVYRANKAAKRGGRVKVESMDHSNLNYIDEHGAGKSAIAKEVDSVASDGDTPEELALQENAKEILEKAINSLPKLYKEPFILARIEGLPGAEIAEKLGKPAATVRNLLHRADEMVKESLKRGTGTTKGIKVKGNERGSIDPELLLKGAAITGFAMLGGYLSTDVDEDGNRTGTLGGALTGAGLAAGALFIKGKKGSIAGQMSRGVSHALEPISSRIRKISEPILHQLVKHEVAVLKTVHNHFEKVAPFLQELDRLRYPTKFAKLTRQESEGARILDRAILTGRPAVTERILKKLNRPELTAAWKEVRSVLDSVGDQLVALGRFKPGDLEYFPRIVKDLEGLRKALGTKHVSFLDNALQTAEEKMLKTKRRGLTDIERSLIINKVLREQEWNSHQPGYAKDRQVNVIPDELLDFYHTPSESLHTYIRSAVKDIERAKFFGQHLRTSKNKAGKYTNIDDSIGAYVNTMLKDKKITQDQHDELVDVLKSRFGNGEKAPAEFIQMASNLSYASLLGNVLSATSQLGDVVISLFTQGMMPTLDGLLRTVSGNKRIGVRDLGLVDHIAEEFADSMRSARFVNKVFKLGLFTQVDMFGKNTVINAAVSKFARMAKTEEGQAAIHAKLDRRMGLKEVDEFINDLNKGEMSDLVQTMAFTELSRTQPISKLELPQLHLDNPNGRIFYQYKTFMIKQLDLMNQESLQLIKRGQYVKGMTNLLAVSTLLGMGGASTNYIKQYMKNLYLSAAGHEQDNIELKASDIPLNMFKTFGLSQYVLDRMTGVTKAEAEERRESGEAGARKLKATPAEAIMNMATPSSPAEIFDTIARHDKTAFQKLPLIGWLVKLEQEAQAEENK